MIAYSSSTKIENCYFGGKICGTSKQALVGYVYSPKDIINSYFDLTKATNDNYVKNEQAKTTAELKSKETFINWDFENTWKIDNGKSYPLLISN